MRKFIQFLAKVCYNIDVLEYRLRRKMSPTQLRLRWFQGTASGTTASQWNKYSQWDY